MSIAERPRLREAVQADPRHPHPAAVPYLRLAATSRSTKQRRSPTATAKPAQTTPRRKKERRQRSDSWLGSVLLLIPALSFSPKNAHRILMKNQFAVAPIFILEINPHFLSSISAMKFQFNALQSCCRSFWESSHGYGLKKINNTALCSHTPCQRGLGRCGVCISAMRGGGLV